MGSVYEIVQLSSIRGRKPRGDRRDIGMLAESISQVGEMIHAPVVVENGQGYELIAGANRLAAAKKLGWESVRCLVLDQVPNSISAKLAFIDENIMRVELPSADRDKLFIARRQLVEQLDPSQAPKARKGGRPKKPKKSDKNKTSDAASEVSRSKSDEPQERQTSRATRRQREAAPDVYQMYAGGDLKQTQLDELVAIKDPETQLEVAQEVVGLTRNKTRAAVRAAVNKAALPTKRAAHFVSLLEQLEEHCSAVSAFGAELVKVGRKLNVVEVGGVRAFMSVTNMISAVVTLKEVTEFLEGGRK
jgi:ParB family transcriptional regulator, chromosome partitioning protein